MTAHPDSTHVPPRVWHAVTSDLRPVRRLRPPASRALLVAPLALALLVAAPMTFSWRLDLVRLGWALTWGASIAQVIVGLGLVALALREAVPGRGLSAATSGTAFVGAGTMLGVVTLLAATSGDVFRPGDPWRIGGICFGGSFASGVPVVLVAAWLARRAFPLRPAMVGALYGLGAGLMADAGWRLFCEFSGPAHVFPFHLGAIAANTLCGVLSALLLTRRRN